MTTHKRVIKDLTTQLANARQELEAVLADNARLIALNNTLQDHLNKIKERNAKSVNDWLRGS